MLPKRRVANLILRACACQRWIAFSERDFGRTSVTDALAEPVSPLRRRRPFGVLDHVINSGREILNARARYDDCVPAAVGFLGDPEEFNAIVFAEFNVEMLPFDLQLPRLDEIIH